MFTLELIVLPVLFCPIFFYWSLDSMLYHLILRLTCVVFSLLSCLVIILKNYKNNNNNNCNKGKEKNGTRRRKTRTGTKLYFKNNTQQDKIQIIRKSKSQSTTILYYSGADSECCKGGSKK